MILQHVVAAFASFDFTNGETMATTVQIALLLTVLTIAPGILIMMTCFTRIIIVLAFVRQGLATQSTPPNQVLIGLALFITAFIMAPVIQEVYETAYVPLAAHSYSIGNLIGSFLQLPAPLDLLRLFPALLIADQQALND